MDCLQDWPEPVVRVQSLSDNGATVIPDRYIKPPSKRPSLDPSSASDLSIPIIDFRSLMNGPVEWQATVRAVSEACKEWGFFQVLNHGVNPVLMSRTRDVWRGFFHLPMEEKQLYANSPKTYEGYGSRIGIERGAILDWGDYFYLHLLPESLKDRSKWPHLPSTCRDTVEEYGREVVKLCRVLMRVLSAGLGLDVDYMQRMFGGDDIGASMRVNYYPRCPQPDLTLGLSAHSDPGGMTVLLPDDCVKGLQVRKGDAWITVQPLPDALIVNVGDQIQVLSNAIYKSVEHRVMVNAATERLSIAFFYSPRSDLPLGPAPALVTPDRSALYKAMTFDEYRFYIRKYGPRGKSQLESLKES